MLIYDCTDVTRWTLNTEDFTVIAEKKTCVAYLSLFNLGGHKTVVKPWTKELLLSTNLGLKKSEVSNNIARPASMQTQRHSVACCYRKEFHPLTQMYLFRVSDLIIELAYSKCDSV